MKGSAVELVERHGVPSLVPAFAAQVPAVGWTTDRALRITSTHGEFVNALAAEPQQFVGRTVYELFGGDRAAAAVAAHVGALDGERSRFPHVWRGRDFDAVIEPLRDDGAIVGCVGLAIDVTDRHAAAAHVAMHRDIVSHMDVGLYVYVLEDPDDATSLRMVEANVGSERATGVEPASVIGKRLLDAFPALAETELPQIYYQIALGAPTRDFGDVVYSDDRINEQTFAVRAFSLPGRKVGISFANVTAQRKLEAQLRQSQKMEAVGRLAGGVAHDFNNLLLAISGYANFALDRPDGGDPALRADLEEISKASARAATLTSQLLAFSRQQLLQPKPLNLNDSVVDIEKMLQRLLGEDIAIVTTLDPNLGQVLADRSQIDQIVVNLAVNARDAMPDGGTLTLETASLHLDEQAAAALFGAEPGPYIVLSVSDTGEGMDEATRTHAFEPFFTTKPQGVGSGLGLSTVYGIVKQSGGYVTIDSAPGVGATFTIYLRRSDEVVEAAAAPVAEPPPSGNETLLLVEDEDVVRRVVTLMLKRHGYEVVAVAGPNEALELFRDGVTFDLVVTDIVMPEMKGPELVRRLLEQSPQLKVIYTSGYTSHAVLDSSALTSTNAYLQKPFSATELARKVRDVLDAAHPA